MSDSRESLEQLRRNNGILLEATSQEELTELQQEAEAIVMDESEVEEGE